MRDRVDAVPAQRVATQESATTEPRAAPSTVRADGFRHVVRAGRKEPARTPKERREKQLVAFKKHEEHRDECCVDSSCQRPHGTS